MGFEEVTASAFLRVDGELGSTFSVLTRSRMAFATAGGLRFTRSLEMWERKPTDCVVKVECATEGFQEFMNAAPLS